MSTRRFFSFRGLGDSGFGLGEVANDGLGALGAGADLQHAEDGTIYIRFGSEGDLVFKLQFRLREFGLYGAPRTAWDGSVQFKLPDGKYDDETKRGVVNFQTKYGVVEPRGAGNVGEYTWAMLFAASDAERTSVKAQYTTAPALLLANPLLNTGATTTAASAPEASAPVLTVTDLTPSNRLTSTLLRGGTGLPTGGAATPAAAVKEEVAEDEDEIARLKEELARAKAADNGAQLKALMDQIAALKAETAQKKMLAEGLETPGEKLKGALTWAALPGIAAGGAYAMKKMKVAMVLGVAALGVGIYRYVRSPAHLAEET